MLEKRNYFTTKANVLKYLQPKLKKSKIEKIFDFTVKEWKNDEKLIISIIKNKFKKGKIIVRSSAIGEDSIEKSNAGIYESVLNVEINNEKNITTAITTVIKSYNENGNYDENNQILIQNQTQNIQISGVVFTKTPDSASPYFVINYEEGPATDGVTKGIVNNCVKLFRETTTSEIPLRWKKLIISIKEIESTIHSNFLDIEFGITKSNKIIIFQVRPITSLKEHQMKISSSKILKLIENTQKKFLENNKEEKFGDYTIFSDMSDWNPAEIIGDNPNLLDYSLYDFLIMNKNWHLGRNKIGYQDMGDTPLMVRFGTKPYVDVRASFNSLIPKIIPSNLKKKLMKYYLEKLKKYPFLHDKIEFEILFTCYDFTINTRINELKKYGFTNKEISLIKNNLKNFTNNIIDQFPMILNNCNKSIECLTHNRELINLNSKTNNHKDFLLDAEKLLKDCKQFGTLPFSTMARISFISSVLLKSLPENKKIPKKFVENFLRSIDTPISNIQDDVESLINNKISKKQFLKKYGHLRPGTYDITVLRYDNEEKFFENLKFLKRTKPSKFSISDNSLNEIMNNHGLEFNKINFLDFIKESITQRENLKFEFSKNLSDALELIAKAGEKLGFSRHDLAYLDIKTILKSKNESITKTKKLWKKKISKEKNYSDVCNLMILPPMLSEKSDLHYVQYFISKPNFITSAQITGDTLNLKKIEEKVLDLENKIILIEHADPGYDWIFTKKPKALITKYGGVASHMSIRCYEIGLPAAIGCGEILYQKLLNASKILLDCENKQVISLIDKKTDEYMQIKKTLKSLGYTK
jgi:glutamine kinase